jgi:Na+/H+-dicarboxylate symporter
VISAISVAIGLTLANTISPASVSIRNAARLQQRFANDATTQVRNASSAHAPDAADVRGRNDRSEEPVSTRRGQRRREHAAPHVLRVVIGIAITLLPVTVTAPVLRVLEGLYEITRRSSR